MNWYDPVIKCAHQSGIHSRGETIPGTLASPQATIDNSCLNKAAALDGPTALPFLKQTVASQLRGDIAAYWKRL